MKWPDISVLRLTNPSRETNAPRVRNNGTSQNPFSRTSASPPPLSSQQSWTLCGNRQYARIAAAMRRDVRCGASAMTTPPCDPSCGREPDSTGRSRGTSVKSRRIRARQRRHAEVGCPGHDKSSSRHSRASNRNVGSHRRLPAMGISVPNADRTQHRRSRASFRVAFATSGSGYIAIERLVL